MILLQILLLLQDSHKHLSSIILILWITREQSLILISSLRLNMLLSLKRLFIPNNKIPIEIYYFHIVSFPKLNRDLGQGLRVQSILLPKIPSVPKPPELPQCNRYSSHDKTHSTLNLNYPKKTSSMSYDTTTPKILDTLIFSLVLVLGKHM
jgi:hypothetical protein